MKKNMPQSLKSLIEDYAKQNNIPLSNHEIDTYTKIYGMESLKDDDETLIRLLSQNIEKKKSEITQLKTDNFDLSLRFMPFIEHFKNNKLSHSDMFSYQPIAKRFKGLANYKIIQRLDETFKKLKISS